MSTTPLTAADYMYLREYLVIAARSLRDTATLARLDGRIDMANTLHTYADQATMLWRKLPST